MIVSGLSGGGTVTTWLAQERSDVDMAVPISPFLGIGFLLAPLTRSLTNLLLLAPDIHMWWDPIHKLENPHSASYSYRGYWLHSLLETMRLGFSAASDAGEVKPAASSILVITNAHDDSVNNTVTAGFVEKWRNHGEEFLATFEFPKDQKLPHDMITYTRPESHPDIVYAKFLELVR